MTKRHVVEATAASMSSINKYINTWFSVKRCTCCSGYINRPFMEAGFTIRDEGWERQEFQCCAVNMQQYGTPLLAFDPEIVYVALQQLDMTKETTVYIALKHLIFYTIRALHLEGKTACHIDTSELAYYTRLSYKLSFRCDHIAMADKPCDRKTDVHGASDGAAADGGERMN